MDQTTTASSSYDAAIQALHSTLHISKSREAIDRSAARRKQTISDMATYVDRLGLAPPPATQIRILHIAGTKGKGSVACMCERILRHHGYRTGLFTSPHLVDLRERMRIGGRLVARDVLAQAYWNVRRTLEQAAAAATEDDLPVLPGYFRMLTLVALYIFTNYRSKDDKRITCWILEVGLGGRYDATQAFHHLWSRSKMSHPAPPTPRLVCGVTLIDYDHVRVLGHTLEEIAWEKGGIFGGDQADDGASRRMATCACCCFALDTNTPRVLQVLRECCSATPASQQLITVGNHNTPRAVCRSLIIGLPGEHQYANAELAVALCEAATSIDDLSLHRIPEALQLATWPGRCQQIEFRNNIRLFLDGAHTVESLRSGVAWFGEQTRSSSSMTVLVFYCSHEKNPVDLFRQLMDAETAFDLVLFTKAASERPSGQPVPTVAELLGDDTESVPAGRCWEMTLCHVWQRLAPQEQVAVVDWCESVPDTLDRIADEHPNANVLVTGSLYLVGSVLEVVGWNESETDGTLS